MTRILLIDDDEKLGPPLSEYFERFSLELETAHHPADGLKRIETEHFDLVILDVMLPDQDGFEVCREIRRTSSIPVVMLTARGEVTDRVVGLELGADDYLPKPFEPRELVARIQNVLRRSGAAKADNTELLVCTAPATRLSVDQSHEPVARGQTFGTCSSAVDLSDHRTVFDGRNFFRLGSRRTPSSRTGAHTSDASPCAVHGLRRG